MLLFVVCCLFIVGCLFAALFWQYYSVFALVGSCLVTFIADVVCLCLDLGVVIAVVLVCYLVIELV